MENNLCTRGPREQAKSISSLLTSTAEKSNVDLPSLKTHILSHLVMEALEGDTMYPWYSSVALEEWQTTAHLSCAPVRFR